MNPSAKDWIPKFLSYINDTHLSSVFTTNEEFYNVARRSGFIYGNSVSLIEHIPGLKLKMTPEEAINAATINGAYGMGLEKEVGSIPIGKLAKLILTKPT